MLSSEVRALESENRALKKTIEKLDMKCYNKVVTEVANKI